jgi:hypothetical protein
MTATAVTNPFQACLQIILKPNGVFEVLEDAKNWSWIPFLLISAATMLPSYLYFGAVNFEWYLDVTLGAQTANLSPAEIEAQRSLLTPETAKIGIYTTPLLLAIASAVLALYLNLATKGDEENINGFTDWFGFTWWVSIPSIISGLIATVLILLSSSNEINPTIIAPTSLAYVLGTSPDSDWYTFLQSASLTMVWGIYLTAVGINRWTDLGYRKSSIIAILPYAVVGGIWIIALVV